MKKDIRDFYYGELVDLFDNISEKNKVRLIYRYVLRLPTAKIAELEKCSTEAIRQSFELSEQKLKDIRKHDDLIDKIISIFAR